MEHMQGPMPRERSDDFVDRIEAGWDERGWSLWAVEVPGAEPFIGYVGLWAADYVTGAPIAYPHLVSHVFYWLSRDRWRVTQEPA